MWAVRRGCRRASGSRSRRVRSPSRRARCRCRCPAATGARWTALGVRPKRGAGAGWGAPSTSTNVLARDVVRVRARLASSSSTGAKHTSWPAKNATHSSRVRVRKSAAKRSFSAGHCARSICCAGSRSSKPSGPSSASRFGVELRLVRRDRHVLAVGASRTRCRSARRRRAGSCRAAPQPPIASMPKKMLISCALPSTIAASTTWPSPGRRPFDERGEDAHHDERRRRRRSRRAG